MIFRKDGERRAQEASLLLVLGFFICLAFLNSPGTADREVWLQYMDLTRRAGLFAAYPIAAIKGVEGATADYPPLGFLILGVWARIADAFRITDFTGLKISLLVFTLACASVAAVWQQRWRPVLAVAMFLTLVVGAMMEAYIDVYFILFLLLAFYCFERKYLSTGTALFAVSCLIKWQPIILTPLVLLYVIPRRPRPADFARLAPAAALGLLIFLVYADPMIRAFTVGLGNPRLSGQGLNFNWLITGWIERNLPTQDGLVTTLWDFHTYYMPTSPGGLPIPATAASTILLGMSNALRYLCYLAALLYFYASDRSALNLVRASLVCFLSYFIFGYGVHENHACVPAALGICWFAMDRTRFVEATVLAVLFNVNLLIFYGLRGAGLGFSRVVGVDTTLYLAAFNLIFFSILWLPIASAVQSAVVEAGLRMRAKLVNRTG